MSASLSAALICVALVATWQKLTVNRNAQGNWTALYYTGDLSATPAQLGDEDIYRHAGTRGYDGQYYHYVAHDPFLARGLDCYVDNPRLRWRRILVPLAAWTLALGSDEYVDSLYFATMLMWTGFGAFFLARYAHRNGRSAFLGIAFPFIPATLVSLDRMTIDLPLAALSIALLLYAGSPAIFAVLTLAPLVRETGFVLIAAYTAFEASRENWKLASLACLCAIPALGWALYVHTHTAPDLTPWTATIPFSGLAERTLHPAQYATTTQWLRTAAILDYAAVLGIWTAIALTVYLALRHRPWPLTTWALVLFTAFVSTLGKADIWTDAYAFGRTHSPLLIWLAMLSISRRFWPGLLPIALVLPRLLFQLQPQLKAILR